MSLVGYAFLSLTLAFSLYGQLVLKWRAVLAGAATVGRERFAFIQAMLLDPWVWSALAASGLGLLAWMSALNHVPLARGYAFLALLYVFVPLGTWWLFHETLLPLQICGIGLIVLGVALVELAAA